LTLLPPAQLQLQLQPATALQLLPEQEGGGEEEEDGDEEEEGEEGEEGGEGEE
jgi:hypothetical protein